MKIRILLSIIFVAIISACASPIKQAELYAAKDEWLKAVIEYRKVLADDPGNIEYRSRLKQTELKAADFYYQQGLKMLALGNIDGAIVEYQRGLIAKPDHVKLGQSIKELLARKEANDYTREGIQNKKAGRHQDARRLFQKALEVYPDHKQAASELQKYKLMEEAKISSGLALSSKAPITLNFKKTALKTAFEFIVKSFGINVIFDEGVKDTPITLFAKNVTFEQALNLVMVTTQTFYKKIGRNTILVAPDTKGKRGQYEDHIIRIFNLKNIKAKDMAKLIKGVLSLKKVIINEAQNSLLIRDTNDVLDLVDKLISANDRKPAELILDVEILEVNRTKAEQLGLDFGSQISVRYDEASTFQGALDARTWTLPGITLRYFKQDVDSKTLANPKIRVIDDKPAKIHIGDRVPLRSSTIVDNTGQTRTTFEYRDIGIKLNVEPDIHLDNSVTVKLKLEVSSLGPDLGTPDEPAFSIGTRNAETFMLLRDGETAILGGLIRDEDRKTRIKVPGLGDIPILGALFTSYDDQTTRTDVLLTITPRIVRAWEIPEKDLRKIYSGTEKTYTNQALFAYLDEVADPNKSPKIAFAEQQDRGTETTPTDDNALAKKTVSSGLESLQAKIRLGFQKPAYTVVTGDEITIHLTGERLEGITTLPFDILYNPNLLQFVDSAAGEIDADHFSTKEEASKGVLHIDLQGLQADDDGSKIMARIKMRGLKSGISYLVFRAGSYVNRDGKSVNAQVQASRIVIR